MPLVTLSYVSVAAHSMSKDELMEILEVARKRNKELDVTGMLLYRDGYFIQALEGEKENVDMLYEKIAKDPRHHHVHAVEQKEISQRVFGDWAMGFHHLDEEDMGDVEGFTDFLEQPFNMSNVEDTNNRALAMLEIFKSGAAY